MAGEQIDSSHEIHWDGNAPDAHSPGVRCAKCKARACGHCGEPDMDILLAPCAGIPWRET